MSRCMPVPYRIDKRVFLFMNRSSLFADLGSQRRVAGLWKIYY